MIKHIVMMKFIDAGHADEAVNRLRALGAKVDQIRSMTVGADVVHSAVSYDLGMITTHNDLDELRSYQQHPEHRRFAAWVHPLLESRAAVDLLDDA